MVECNILCNNFKIIKKYKNVLNNALENFEITQGKTVEQIKAIIASLHEFNPMMGHRGCRLAVTFPEIARMQTRAVIKAAINVSKRKGINIVPEIMIPLVGEVKELKYVKGVVCETADEVIKEIGRAHV